MTRTVLYPLTLFLCRHAETAWTLSGQHTGRTDLPLTDRGKESALLLGKQLQPIAFHLILSSPLRRAKETCTLALPNTAIQEDPDLMEYDYGDYEGLTTAEIRKKNPAWSLFNNGAPNGESLDQVSARADRFLAKVRQKQGNIAIFSHGHFSRVLLARWLNLPVKIGEHFLLSVGSISILGSERETPVIRLWNYTGPLS